MCQLYRYYYACCDRTEPFDSSRMRLCRDGERVGRPCQRFIPAMGRIDRPDYCCRQNCCDRKLVITEQAYLEAEMELEEQVERLPPRDAGKVSGKYTEAVRDAKKVRDGERRKHYECGVSRSQEDRQPVNRAYLGQVLDSGMTARNHVPDAEQIPVYSARERLGFRWLRSRLGARSHKR